MYSIKQFASQMTMIALVVKQVRDICRTLGILSGYGCDRFSVYLKSSKSLESHEQLQFYVGILKSNKFICIGIQRIYALSSGTYIFSFTCVQQEMLFDRSSAKLQKCFLFRMIQKKQAKVFYSFWFSGFETIGDVQDKEVYDVKQLHFGQVHKPLELVLPEDRREGCYITQAN